MNTVSKHKVVHKRTLFKSTLGQILMTFFAVVSYHICGKLKEESFQVGWTRGLLKQQTGHCEALLVEIPLKCHMEVRDSGCRLADRGGGSHFLKRRLEGEL